MTIVVERNQFSDQSTIYTYTFKRSNFSFAPRYPTGHNEHFYLFFGLSSETTACVLNNQITFYFNVSHLKIITQFLLLQLILYAKVDNDVQRQPCLVENSKQITKRLNSYNEFYDNLLKIQLPHRQKEMSNRINSTKIRWY